MAFQEQKAIHMINKYTNKSCLIIAVETFPGYYTEQQVEAFI